MKETDSSEYKLKKSDFFVLFSILTCIIIFVLVFHFTKKNGTYAEITVDGEIYGTYSLLENQEISIKDSGGDVTNIAVIKDGEIYMAEATCPDKLCIKQGKKNDANSEIVCLPNKVVISVKSDKKADFDTFAQ